MFTTLLESRATRTRRTGGTTLSAVVHGALIATGVTLGAHKAPSTILERPRHVAISFVPMTPRPHPPASSTSTATSSVPRAPERVDVVIAPPTITPIGLPPITTGREIPPDHITIGDGLAPVTGVSTKRGIEGGIVDVNQVERAPAVVGQPRPPRYPTMLRDSGTNGNVVIRFVIDTLGRAELGDVTVVESSHSLFTDAVRAALVDYRFAPGEIGGRKVRTMVQMPFNFRVDSRQ